MISRALERNKSLNNDLMKRLKCIVCGKIVHECYMIKHKVWFKEAGLTRKQNLHLKCLSKHLGRFLTIEDFRKDLLINDEIMFGYQLAKDE